MSTDGNFVGGYLWLVWETESVWCLRHTEESVPVPERHWPDLVGKPFEAVSRAPRDHEVPNGKGGWRLDHEPARAIRRRELAQRHDERLSGDFQTTFGPVDAAGREALDAIAWLALLAPEASYDFRLSDGTLAVLTSAQVIELQIEMKRHLAALAGARWATEKKIAIARSRPQIAGIDIDASYPRMPDEHG